MKADIFTLCEWGEWEELKKLLEEDPTQVHLRDDEQNTPLHYARDRRVAGLLVQYGADLEAKNMEGLPPIATAARKLREEVVAFLLEKEVTLEKSYFYFPGSLWTIEDMATKAAEKRWNTVLHGAGNREEAERFLLEGANMEERAFWGQTPLMKQVDEKRLDVVQLLLEHGTNIHAQDEEGNSALHYAVQRRSVREEMVQLLLEHGADPNLPNHKGETPLHWAIMESDIDKAALFMNSTSVKDWKGKPSIVKQLLDAGGDPNIQDHRGQTPLHWAVFGDHWEMVDLLLNHGASLLIRSHDGKRPQHMADRRNSLYLYCAEKARELESFDSPLMDTNVSKPYSFVLHPYKHELVSAYGYGGIAKW
ncbi:ankyrin repeat domain-containing protein [Thermoflavimicrobium dichotomicum]|uniref:Ankyrin repeat n=1 Tax=Thermoflavimicrobium dichotomicum TaxID=46223 RepID=A0A1I3T7E3_9BACL|nr:ankyrin repeat domain-containing protein [Thermoflavimicrobium dichotomicum]SFJ66412.1 Ankyrin repeat [Thermoflavimicrobium dichotomicum]